MKIIDFGTSTTYDPNSKMTQTFGTPYYIAPEVLRGSYDYKCDLWSLGVILYILLTGRPPFDGKSDTEIMKNVCVGKVNYNLPIFSKISKEGLDLMKKLLVLDTRHRITASDALKHLWFVKFNNKDLDNRVSQIALSQLTNLKDFTGRSKMQQAAMTFITSHLMNNQEMSKMKQIFEKMDANFDGKLTKDEIVKGFTDLGIPNPVTEAEKIFEIADSDGNGYVEFTEWCTATMDKRKMLTRDRLKAAFNMIDEDGSGQISFQEVRKLLDHGGSCDTEYFK